MFKVIIAGGRDFDDYGLLSSHMDKLLANVIDDIEIVCGMSKGADKLGEQYAKERGYKTRYFFAEWDLYGRGAGFKRNNEMACYADALVAFWDGKSHGTKHMIQSALNKKLDVRIKRYE